MTIVERERRKRIKASLAAYAYEFLDETIMTDGDFDELLKTIDINIKTGHNTLDEFFETVFSPHTGQWIHKHPELDGIRRVYERVWKKRK